MDIGYRFARVLVSGLWGLLALNVLQRIGVTLPAEHIELFQQGLVVFLAAIINGLVGMFSKKYPWLEWLLLVGFKPDYTTLPKN